MADARELSVPSQSKGAARRLFLLGFFALFVELCLIRYLAGNVWNLGYFPNLVLIAAFAGLGIGFVFHHALSDRHSALLFHGSLGILLLLVGFVTLARPRVPGFQDWGAEVGGELFFTATPSTSSALAPLLFGVWFFAVVAIFALLAQRTAKVFRQFTPLRAYSLDIAGSCAGIVAFMAVSWLELPAWTWFLVLIPVYLGAMPQGGRLRWLLPPLALGVIAALGWHQDQRLLSDPHTTKEISVIWSPYQKVAFSGSSVTDRSIFVNGIAHQHLLPAAHLRLSSYAMPHIHRSRTSGKEPYGDVLVIGAGTGNDVAAALGRGATHVDAVEIDPAIARLGQQHHPARPYDDPRVRLVVDDARAFLTRTTRRYDLIVFALTDSLVKVSPVAQLRLENYVFTEESIARAFSLLSEDGDLAFYNSYRRPWLIDKLRETVYRATGRYPRTVYRSEDFAVLMAGRKTAAPEPPAARSAKIHTPTDDWPFLYLNRRGIPGLYLAAMGVIAAFVLLLLVALHRGTRHLHAGTSPAASLLLKLAFVLMGTAFLLLETKGVIQFSLLFGTTWVNNSLVFLAALALVLAANAFAARIRLAGALPITFVVLLFASLVPLLYPLSNLLSVHSPLLRFVCASLLVFSPIFFANLLFSLTFRKQPVAEQLFGWNLLGATLGGVVEYTSMWTGYNALSLVVAICYCAVFVLLWGSRRLQGQSAA